MFFDFVKKLKIFIFLNFFLNHFLDFLVNFFEKKGYQVIRGDLEPSITVSAAPRNFHGGDEAPQSFDSIADLFGSLDFFEANTQSPSSKTHIRNKNSIENIEDQKDHRGDHPPHQQQTSKNHKNGEKSQKNHKNTKISEIYKKKTSEISEQESDDSHQNQHTNNIQSKEEGAGSTGSSASNNKMHSGENGKLEINQKNRSSHSNDDHENRRLSNKKMMEMRSSRGQNQSNPKTGKQRSKADQDRFLSSAQKDKDFSTRASVPIPVNGPLLKESHQGQSPSEFGASGSRYDSEGNQNQHPHSEHTHHSHQEPKKAQAHQDYPSNEFSTQELDFRFINAGPQRFNSQDLSNGSGYGGGGYFNGNNNLRTDQINFHFDQNSQNQHQRGSNSGQSFEFDGGYPTNGQQPLPQKQHLPPSPGQGYGQFPGGFGGYNNFNSNNMSIHNTINHSNGNNNIGGLNLNPNNYQQPWMAPPHHPNNYHPQQQQQQQGSQHYHQAPSQPQQQPFFEAAGVRRFGSADYTFHDQIAGIDPFPNSTSWNSQNKKNNNLNNINSGNSPNIGNFGVQNQGAVPHWGMENGFTGGPHNHTGLDSGHIGYHNRYQGGKIGQPHQQPNINLGYQNSNSNLGFYGHNTGYHQPQHHHHEGHNFEAAAFNSLNIPVYQNTQETGLYNTNNNNNSNNSMKNNENSSHRGFEGAGDSSPHKQQHHHHQHLHPHPHPDYASQSNELQSRYIPTKQGGKKKPTPKVTGLKLLARIAPREPIGDIIDEINQEMTPKFYKLLDSKLKNLKKITSELANSKRGRIGPGPPGYNPRELHHHSNGRGPRRGRYREQPDNRRHTHHYRGHGKGQNRKQRENNRAKNRF